MLRRWHGYWTAEAGPGEVLRLALPLVLATSSVTVQLFVDRLFLAWYNAESIAAALPAALVAHVIVYPFYGLTSYVNSFVAQYHGAGRHDRVGAVMWQGIYLGAVTGTLLLVLWPAAGPLFDWIGHELEVRRLEAEYFRVLLVGGAPWLVSTAVSSLFSGLGRTWAVFWVNVAATAVNVVLDYALIFGHWGFPELGIAGAGWATVAAYCTAAVLFLALAFGRVNRQKFATLAAWRPEPALVFRIMRFGLPNAVLFAIDFGAWTLFLVYIGRLGTVELAATNVACNINLIAFLPMLGFGLATSTLVGQYLGAERPEPAAHGTWWALGLTSVYTVLVAAAYLLAPDLFLAPFRAGMQPDDYAASRELVTLLLRFIALYALFDAMGLVFMGALRGAGDTAYIMTLTLVLAAGVLVVPTYLVCQVWHWGLYGAWSCAAAYVILLGLGFFLRFLGGQWKEMRVIERVPAVLVEPAQPT